MQANVTCVYICILWVRFILAEKLREDIKVEWGKLRGV